LKTLWSTYWVRHISHRDPIIFTLWHKTHIIEKNNGNTNCDTYKKKYWYNVCHLKLIFYHRLHSDTIINISLNKHYRSIELEAVANETTQTLIQNNNKDYKNIYNYFIQQHAIIITINKNNIYCNFTIMRARKRSSFTFKALIYLQQSIIHLMFHSMFPNM